MTFRHTQEIIVSAQNWKDWLGTVGKNSVKRRERCSADALLDIKFGRIRGDSGCA
jgi:hypothetical protein